MKFIRVVVISVLLLLSLATLCVVSYRGSSQIPHENVGNIRTGSFHERMLNATVLVVTGNDHRGTGFALNDGGQIITDKHIVGEDSEVIVRFHHGEELIAVVEERDDIHDLALIRVPAEQVPQYVEPIVLVLATKPLERGDRVFSINHLAGFDWSYAEGYVMHPSYRKWIQIDLTTAGGASGGGVFDEKGNLIAIIQRVHNSRSIMLALPIQHVCRKLLKCPSTSPAGEENNQ